jgi:signal transduction histidine kinase
MEHDIRTPVSGLFAVTNVLMKQETDPDKKEMLEVVAMASKEILDYANSILNFSKIESESVPVLQKKFVLKKIIESVINLEATTAMHKKLEFRIDFPENLPQVLIGDAYRLKRILINLMSNALKFTHQGFVRLAVELASQKDARIILRFKIEDSGIGIPKEKQDYIYEKFVRITPSNEGIYKGFGLGLRIVKQFVREMDGEIDLKSSEKAGTTFICTFPFKIPLIEDILEDEGITEDEY